MSPHNADGGEESKFWMILPARSEASVSKTRAYECSLPIGEITFHPGLQMRVEGLSDDHVEDIIRAAKARKKIPPIQVYRVEGMGDLVVDGHHTVEGFKRAGRRMVPAIVRLGDFRDAVMAAAAANLHDGCPLKRTNADKRRAIGAVLRIHPEWSNNRIAEHVGVTDKTVAEERSTLEATSEIPKLEMREGSDGKTRNVPASTTQTPTADPELGVDDCVATDLEDNPYSSVPPDLPHTSAKTAAKETPRPLDWSKWSAHFGWLIRAVDSIAKQEGEGEDSEKALQILGAFGDHIRAWRFKVTGRQVIDF